jgi:hypothetical protein
MVGLTLYRLAVSVEPIDTVLVYVTGHGAKVRWRTDTEGTSAIQLNQHERLSQADFERLLVPLKPYAGAVIYDPCYLGLNHTELPCEWVGLSAATSTTVTHGSQWAAEFWGNLRRSRDLMKAFEAAALASPRDAPMLRKCKSPEVPDLEL